VNLLNLIIFIPLLAIVAIVLGAPARLTALGASIINLVLSVAALAGYDRVMGGFQFQFKVPVLAEWDLNYFVGADGLSLLMILLCTIVTVAAVAVAPQVDKYEGAYFASVLAIGAGAIGAFSSLDLFFFYAFHELALIPTFLLIGIWGFNDRQRAAWKITIYLAAGSIILLIGLIGLYLMVPEAQRTFDMVKLQEIASAGGFNSPNGHRVFLLLLVGFGVLVSLFPFHSWAPGAYGSAPTPAAMLHAGVLKKFGLYGLIRLAVPMLPASAEFWTNTLLVLLVGNIIYVGLVTIAQKRLDQTLGYSSVMHMGYIFLGVASGNAIGINGAALLMFAHGLSIAALFAMAGKLREATGTLEYADLGGLAKKMPVAGLLFGLAAFASIGLPGFANFAAEVMVFFGAFGAGGMGTKFTNFQITTVLALWGVVISAVYMLRAYRAVFLGEMSKRWENLKDFDMGMRLPVALLIGALLIAGFCPNLVLKYLQTNTPPATTAAATR